MRYLALGAIQAATEFFPVSSSGHLALFSKLFTTQNLFFFTLLHLASLLAVLIFTRKEVFQLFKFNEESKHLWAFLILATIPATFFGLIFNDIVENAFSSYFFLGTSFILTGVVLFSTKYIKFTDEALTARKSFSIGMAQVIALLPGVSRSGMTISAGLFSGLSKEKATKFAFLMFIPISLGAFVLELSKLQVFHLTTEMIGSLVLCFVLSLFALSLLARVVKSGKFWMFSFYCWLVGIVSIILFFIS